MKASLASALLAVALGASACRDAAPAPASAEPRRAGLSTREPYRPPDDAVLTAQQVETFLKVREATLRVRATPDGNAPLESEEGISGASEARAAEVRAARSLSVRVDEYFWIRERILEAEAAAMTAKLNADVLALLERTLASLRDRRPAAPDEASRRLLDDQVASFEAEASRVRREAAEKEPEPIRANLAVLAPFRTRISAIEDELAELDAAALREAAAPPATDR
ncbi:MAG: hypothetical protein ACYDBY_00490 [Thermoanaerobaculia bacterium]